MAEISIGTLIGLRDETMTNAALNTLREAGIPFDPAQIDAAVAEGAEFFRTVHLPTLVKSGALPENVLEIGIPLAARASRKSRKRRQRKSLKTAPA